MVRLLGIVVSIGLADSINPSTIAPALYLAAGDHPRARVAEFTVGVFVVYLAGGALITLGPGQLLRSAVPDVDIQHTIRYIGEIVAGAVLIAGSAIIWSRRRTLVARGLPQPNLQRTSSVLLGATITAIELPTAFPYFAAIAAIAGSGLNAGRQTVLLVIFNLCFIAPLIAILATLTFAGERSSEILGSWRLFFERRWPQVLAGLILLVGVGATLLGITGLAAGVHGRVGHFFRRVRHILHHLRP